MQIVNWSGALFGPGSEWFWAFAQFIVVLVTLVAIYRQIRLQSNATAIDQLNEFRREAYSEQMLRYELDVMLALKDSPDRTRLPEAAVLGIGDYWATFATLARAGHRDAKLLWHADSSSPQIVWAWIGAWARKQRASNRFVGGASYEDLEWLADTMARMDREAGRPAVTEATVDANRDAWIELHRDLIRYAKASRTDG